MDKDFQQQISRKSDRKLKARKEIKDIADLGKEIPSSLRFGIIVTVVLF